MAAAIAACLSAAWVPGAQARFRPAIVLSSVPSAPAGGLAEARGRVHALAGHKVLIQRRTRGRWVRVAQGHASPKGRFALTFTAPTRPGSIRVRAVVKTHSRIVGISQVKKLHVRRVNGISPPSNIVVRATVLAPSVVSRAPASGAPGTLIYAGGVDVHPGQIIVIGVGPATPYGFLGRAVSVEQHGGTTTVKTVPATLLEAVPQGSLSAVLAVNQSFGHASRARPASAFSWQCSGSASASLNASASFNTSLTLNANWSLFGGLQSASLVAGANATGSLTAQGSGKGSCSLQATLAKFNGPTATFFVGPVPVVLTSDVTIGVDGSAGFCAGVTSSISAGFGGSAGVGWTSGGGFYPIGSLTSNFSFQPPTPSGGAHLGADLTPTLGILLYGAAGPEIDLKAGLSLDANLATWALTAPVNLSGKLSIPHLGLSSPSLNIYSHTFPLTSGALSNVQYQVPCTP